MRKSLITWKVSFVSAPSAEEIDHVAALLAPIIRVELPNDHGAVLRDMGLSDHLLIEDAAERTASELVLHCLAKAHRIGTGWSILWPEIRKASEHGWAPRDHAFAALPESLDGLTGGFSDGMGAGRSLVPRLYSAMFTITVVGEP